MMGRTLSLKIIAACFGLAILVTASSRAFGAATIVIQNADGAGVGFNDPTSVSPVGNNTGTTLGQQRLNAFQFAANLWGATINSNITIVIHANWANLTCSSSSGVLGQAGAANIFSNFPNAPKNNTWYPVALANALSGTDQNGGSPEINAQFNLKVGTTGCLDSGGTPTPFYLGLDNNFGTAIDLVAVLIHEFAHGLGFQTFTNTSNGSEPSGMPSIFDFFLQDNSTSMTWNVMTDTQRQASAINTGNLVWIGNQSVTDARNALGTARVRVNAPAAVTFTAGGEAFTPDIRARQLALVTSGNTVQVTGNVVAASPADACSAISTAVSGNIALIDRGNCLFTVKVKNAQNAGAIGAIIVDVNNTGVVVMGGADSTVAIPAVLVSQADGATLKGQLGSGLNASLITDASAPIGTDGQGHPRMFAPNPVQSGSSVSHWDTLEFPDLLMEPANTDDIVHSVAIPADLTLSQLRDVGWPGNPIGDNVFFVRQQYLDFLNRQPDSSGYAFWTNDIFSCGIDTSCGDVHRINVSAAFFLSIEFQGTGNLVYKFYKEGFGDISDPTIPVPVRRANFLADKQTVQSTPNQIIVGQGNWQTQLEQNKQAFALAFVQRPAFQSAHPVGQDVNTYVAALFSNCKVTPTAAETAAAMQAFNQAGGGFAGQAAALRSVADSTSVSNALFNESFVLMQYFGYLQRDPDSPPDRDFSGYNFWLNKLNTFGNFVNAEMVKSFLVSTEYRGRFGNP